MVQILVFEALAALAIAWEQEWQAVGMAWEQEWHGRQWQQNDEWHAAPQSSNAGNWGSWVNAVCAQLKDEVRAEVEGLRAEVVERGAEVERLRAVVVELTTEVGGPRSQVGGLRSPQQDVPQPPREPPLSLSLAQQDDLAVAL